MLIIFHTFYLDHWYHFTFSAIMVSCGKMYARKAAWLAFGLVALAAVTSTAQNAMEENMVADAQIVCYRVLFVARL